jgi:hypothetical protein
MDVDIGLITKARQLTTGANVHRIHVLVICYEEAVRKRNQGGAYRPEFEKALRDFVNKTKLKSKSGRDQ